MERRVSRARKTALFSLGRGPNSAHAHHASVTYSDSDLRYGAAAEQPNLEGFGDHAFAEEAWWTLRSSLAPFGGRERRDKITASIGISDAQSRSVQHAVTNKAFGDVGVKLWLKELLLWSGRATLSRPEYQSSTLRGSVCVL